MTSAPSINPTVLGQSSQQSLDPILKNTDERLYELFAELRQAPDCPTPNKKIAIISTPRCGSKFFCESLASTGRFGRPKEWMNIRYVKAYARLFELKDMDLNQYLQFVMAKTTTSNRVFTLNFHVEQYTEWQKNNLDLLRLGFDKLYYVYRKDKLAQALSFAKARLTDQWSSKSGPLRETPIGEINNSDILKALYHLSLQDEYYRTHLAKHVQREYCYEDFTTSNSCFHDVLADNAIEHQDIQIFTSGMAVQRGASDTQKMHDLVSYIGHQ